MCGSMVDIQFPTAEIRRKKKVTATQSIMSGSVPQGGDIIMMTNVTSTRAPFCLRLTRRVASPLRRRHLNASCTELVSHYGASVNQYRHFRRGVSRHGDAEMEVDIVGSIGARVLGRVKIAPRRVCRNGGQFDRRTVRL